MRIDDDGSTPIRPLSHQRASRASSRRPTCSGAGCARVKSRVLRGSAARRRVVTMDTRDRWRRMSRMRFKIEQDRGVRLTRASRIGDGRPRCADSLARNQPKLDMHAAAPRSRRSSRDDRASAAMLARTTMARRLRSAIPVERRFEPLLHWSAQGPISSPRASACHVIATGPSRETSPPPAMRRARRAFGSPDP